MVEGEFLRGTDSQFYIVFTKLPSPQFTEVRFVFCFFLLLTDGWLTRQEFSATSSQNKQRWPVEKISISWYGTQSAYLLISFIRYTRNEESWVELLARTLKLSVPSRRVPIQFSCRGDAAKCARDKTTVSINKPAASGSWQTSHCFSSCFPPWKLICLLVCYKLLWYPQNEKVRPKICTGKAWHDINLLFFILKMPAKNL